ncbi:MAG TPA: cytochrome C [Pseudomonas sp.]|nr:cytochrome C [Pseudomonas sp.]
MRVLILLMLLALAGCDDMARQEKLKAQGSTRVFANGAVNQAPPAFTVARGDLAREARLYTRPPMSRALLERGRERFDIFCSPCHGLLGNGEGVVVQRGFPKPPDLAAARLREAPDRHFIEVISHGYGQMYSYASRIPPADRWAIVAYVRALQRSQGVPLDQLSAAQRRRLEGRP